METKVKNSKAFTLIELIVVIAMVSLVSTLSLSNFRQGEKQRRVSLASDAVINSIRNAQNSILTGKKTTNASATCRTPRFYYVNFDYNQTYSLRAGNNCSLDDLIETYTLPTNTRIKASSLILDGTAATNTLSLQFFPPFGAMKASRDASVSVGFTTATIVVESTDGAVSKTITINGISGRIGE